MNSNLELIRRTYEGSSEENGRNLIAVLDPQVERTEAEGDGRQGAVLMQTIRHPRYWHPV
ncbi:hypothetical protein [Achromobacter mucicolens]|uniref:hypothetical protein n=1 Tax=Achromobacter mucicolens TaxID=1389922 RepID=UPI001F0BDB90|nr:hypothetical protein [Achromobacter mucicolens]